MGAIQEALPEVQALDQLDRDTVLQFSEVLLPTLTDKAWDADNVEKNLRGVLASPNSHLLVLNEAGTVTSTATVNFCRTLTGEGVEAWIDDVVTDPTYQGGGRMKKIMTAAEALVATQASRVSLTSSPDRGTARASYEKSGYQLMNEAHNTLVVYRNSSLGNAALTGADVHILSTNYTDADVEQIAGLLGDDPAVIQHNLGEALASPTTAVIISRGKSGIEGVAVANETPIPVGKKPWIDNIAGSTLDGREEAIAGATAWIGERYEFANVVAPDDVEIGPGYVQRESGLYVKRLPAAV